MGKRLVKRPHIIKIKLCGLIFILLVDITAVLLIIALVAKLLEDRDILIIDIYDKGQ